MSFFALALIGVGLSMDAFAVAIGKGLSLKRVKPISMLIVGAYFGFFQAVMPLVGYLAGYNFAGTIEEYDHWIAFFLLALIGARMIFEALKEDGCKDRKCPKTICQDRECPKEERSEKRASLKPAAMLPLAVATSIDALAVGVSFALLDIDIVSAVALIGIITFLLSAAGLKIGNFFGTKFKSTACILGGIILILMGIKILFEHL